MYAWLSRARNSESNKTITRYDLDDVSRSKFLSTNSVIDFKYFQDAFDECPSFAQSSKEEIYRRKWERLKEEGSGRIGLIEVVWPLSRLFHYLTSIFLPFFPPFLFYSQYKPIVRTKRRSFKRMETVNCRLRIKGRHYADSLGLGNVACTFLSRNYTRSEKEREETEARKWWTVESQLIRGVGSVDAGPTDGGGISDGCWG